MKRGTGRPYAVMASLIAFCAALAGGGSPALAQVLGPIGVSPALPADGDTIAISVDISQSPPTVAGAVLVEGSQIILEVGETIISPQPPTPPSHLVWTVGPMRAGTYTITVDFGNKAYRTISVQPRSAVLPLLAARFQVTVTDLAAGATPAATPLSDSGGYFTFFDATNVELTFKVVDGRAVNDHFWLFVASMTNTPLTVTFTDTQGAGCGTPAGCPTRTYTNPPNTNQNFIDVNAF